MRNSCKIGTIEITRLEERTMKFGEARIRKSLQSQAKNGLNMQPDVAILEMELERMVAASDGFVDVDENTSDNPENADSRLFLELDHVL